MVTVGWAETSSGTLNESSTVGRPGLRLMIEFSVALCHNDIKASDSYSRKTALHPARLYSHVHFAIWQAKLTAWRKHVIISPRGGGPGAATRGAGRRFAAGSASSAPSCITTRMRLLRAWPRRLTKAPSKIEVPRNCSMMRNWAPLFGFA